MLSLESGSPARKAIVCVCEYAHRRRKMDLVMALFALLRLVLHMGGCDKKEWEELIEWDFKVLNMSRKEREEYGNKLLEG